MRTAEERLADVVRAEPTGARPRFVFFWKEAALDPGGLSQWWPAPFVVDGVTYPTAEHWMMAAKARLFEDAPTLEKVLRARTPAGAKSLGRAVRGFSEDRWAAARYEIVVAGNVAKFSQHDELRRFLASTGSRVLVEASPLDRVWGIGLAEDDDRACAPSRWRGRNLLGFALMDVRDGL
jgi:ribA/ribD-fused uncharacterized protein